MYEINEENYPLTYKEYEKKVINLFLQAYPEELQETMVNRLNDALKEDPDLLDGLYGESCFRYDHENLYGETVKKIFEDTLLESIPVNTLHMLLGGNFD